MGSEALYLLKDECAHAEQYPEYSGVNFTLQEKRLFKSEKSRITFWEKRPQDGPFFEHCIYDYNNLDKWLSFHLPDPDFRFVFFEPRNSRAELNCSLRTLQRVFAFHEVHPSFLDYVHSFGDQEDPIDAGLCHFQSDDISTAGYTEDSSEVRNIFMGLGQAIPELGRSGNALRQSYLLRSVERIEDEANWNWSIRQVAVYHSFDTKTGRSLWINIKGNDYLKQAIWDDTMSGKTLQNNSVEFAFQTNLTLHMIYIQWCVENWRWFVRYIESEIQPYMLNVLMAPVENEPYFKSNPRGPWRVETSQSAKFSEMISEASAGTPSYWLGKIKGLPTKWNQEADPEKNTLGMGPGSKKRHKPAVLDLEGLFSFTELQELTKLEERMEEAILVIRLNIKTLQSIKRYYDGLQNLPKLQLPKQAMSIFLSKVEASIDSLEVQLIQLESLGRKLGQGRKLYRALQVSQIFAEKAQESTKTMEHIAFRTAHETSSMHIITVVALIFLPGTFVASFFQSGVFNWDGEAGHDSWTLRNSALHRGLAADVAATPFHISLRLAFYDATCHTVPPTQCFFRFPHVPLVSSKSNLRGSKTSILLGDMEDQREAFQAYVRSNSRDGSSGSNQTDPYICPQHLYDYWKPNEILKVVDTNSPNNIRDEYIKIISIFVWIGSENYKNHIKAFIGRNSLVANDSSLPMNESLFSSFEIDLPKDEQHKFITNQWRFLPVLFNGPRHKPELDLRRIFPIENEKLLPVACDYDSKIYKIRLHRCHSGDHCCNKLGKDDVIFKRMKNVAAWELEVNAYAKVHAPKPIAYVTGFYGSFYQADVGTIVLEYADGDTLEKFFETQHRLEGDEQVKFWDKMFNLAQALYCIHFNSETNSQLIHQDIKPDNILVFTDHDRKSTIFKLNDLGRSDHRIVKVGQITGGNYNDGNKMYSAPEFYNVDSFVFRPEKATPDMDVWALGAIFSEVLVWSIRGEAGRGDYASLRKSAANQEMSDYGYDGCFHNGIERLPTVDSQHDQILTNQTANMNDEINTIVSKIILDTMLKPRQERGNAREVYIQWRNREVLGTTNNAESQAPHDETEMGPSTEVQDIIVTESPEEQQENCQTAETPTSRPGDDKTIEALWTDLMAKISRNKRFLRFSTQFPPEYSWMRAMIVGHESGLHQYYIFIDDSRALMPHKEQVGKTLRVFGKLLKIPLREKLLSVRCSVPGTFAKITKSKNLEKTAARMGFNNDEVQIARMWDGTIQEGIKRLSQATNADSTMPHGVWFYLLTAGAWDPNNAPKMTEGLIKLGRCDGMIGNGLPDASVQIIQYGNDSGATKNIAQLLKAVQMGVGSQEPLIGELVKAPAPKAACRFI
ncbi:hypothetical protein PG995_015753 [Apiospora arundinis]